MSESAATDLSYDDAATVIALGALAATLATLCHETLGHGLGCIGVGGHVTLLTSIWFRCKGGSIVTDAGGPMGNLVAGSLAVALLSYTRPDPKVRLLLLLLGALNLFWFMGQIAFESLAHTREDWYWLLQMGRTTNWRIAGAVAGIGGYMLVRRWLVAVIRKQRGPRAKTIHLAYAAAAAFAIIAGLMWRPQPFRSAFEGLLVLGVAPLGLLTVARRAAADAEDDLGGSSVTRSWAWICACVALVGIFLLLQARGLGSMAAVKLPP
jgi:hypothetical protein